MSMNKSVLKQEDLKKAHTHFKFGENWKNFSSEINEERIEEAKKSLVKFFGKSGIEGKTFLDIGCGSGLFSLAALLLGAKKVVAVDIDTDSVETTRHVLQTFVPKKDFTVNVVSVFDLDPKKNGTFDIVYSWGVLHHTGDMVGAIEKASQMVAPKGLFALALYRKTPLCGFWKKEKCVYTNAPKFIQFLVRCVWYSLFAAGCLVFRRNIVTYIRNYKSSRGMSFSHDVHDWLGGFPYESISPAEMYALAHQNNLKLKSEFLIPSVRFGLLGTGCDEYVFENAD
jgi:2-polyprenyl-6-hydroxyphenyl methylase/3-demethylubiquinone-9 3-methyltransferase